MSRRVGRICFSALPSSRTLHLSLQCAIMTRKFQFSLRRLLVAIPVFAAASLCAAKFAHYRPDPRDLNLVCFTAACILGGAGIGVLIDRVVLRGLLFGALAGWLVPLLLFLLSLLFSVVQE